MVEMKCLVDPAHWRQLNAQSLPVSGYNQKKQDREYFKKHDPLRKFRPDAYDLVYGKGKQLKKREEAPKQENELPKPGN